LKSAPNKDYFAKDSLRLTQPAFVLQNRRVNISNTECVLVICAEHALNRSINALRDRQSFVVIAQLLEGERQPGCECQSRRGFLPVDTLEP